MSSPIRRRLTYEPQAHPNAAAPAVAQAPAVAPAPAVAQAPAVAPAPAPAAAPIDRDALHARFVAAAACLVPGTGEGPAAALALLQGVEEGNAAALRQELTTLLPAVGPATAAALETVRQELLAAAARFRRLPPDASGSPSSLTGGQHFFLSPPRRPRAP